MSRRLRRSRLPLPWLGARSDQHRLRRRRHRSALAQKQAISQRSPAGEVDAQPDAQPVEEQRLLTTVTDNNRCAERRRIKAYVKARALGSPSSQEHAAQFLQIWRK